MKTTTRSFGKLIEENLLKLSHFFIYAVLEWLIIILLFIDGFLAFLSNEIARFFELKIPCLLCTRIDHILVHRNPNFYYNDSICESHKRDISSLAFCHVHKKLSDIRSMCQGCLLSFSTEKDSELDKFKSLVGIMHKDDGGEEMPDEKSGILRCSCCGESLRSRSSSRYKRSLSLNVPAPAPAPSPRAHFFYDGNKGGGSKDLLPQNMYTELKLMSGAGSELPEEEEDRADNHGSRDDTEAAAAIPLSLDSEDINEDVLRTPIFAKGNKFFRIPLSDSAHASPRFYNKAHLSINRKLDFILETNDEADLDGDSLKNQIHLYRKSLMALHMELDEERSASAVAAKNAMAMITRLQAEKAAVQMDALQYQRMMEEQAEYDQEALQVMKDIVLRREEDVKALEAEIEVYRQRYGEINTVSSDICEVDADEDYYHDIKSSGSSSGADQQNEHVGYIYDESAPFEGQRTHLLSLMRDLEEKLKAPPIEIFNSSELFTGKNEDEPRDDENDEMVTREVSILRERIRALEADRDFLKQASMATTQQGDDGTKLLNEIAHHLRRLRQPVISLSDYTKP